MNDYQRWDDDDFPPQEDLDALLMEKTVVPHESDIDLTYRLFEQNAPAAAQKIVYLCHHGQSDKIRLDAAKYIVERVLGRLGDLTAAHHALTIPDQIADRVALTINRVLDDLELNNEQRDKVEEVVPRHLMALAESSSSGEQE